MNGLRFSAATVVCVPMLITSAGSLHAAELRLLAGGAMAGVWAEIKPQFEQVSGHKLDIFFGTTPNLIKEVTSDRPFDVGVVPVEVMQDASARAKFVAGPTIDIAHVGLGVAVRSGAPKPEIGTADALKAALLKAQSVASIPESATGYSIARVFNRLGITEPMKAKIKAQPNPAQVVAVVAKGEVELGIFLINVLTAPGLDVVGPFPAELQENVVFTAAVASKGFRHGPKEVIDRLNRGEAVDPASYYFRTTPYFETSSEKYAWLNRICSIATGSREADRRTFDVFQLGDRAEADLIREY